MDNDWRMIYWICEAFIGTCTILVLFTLPETSWRRQSTVQLDSDDAGVKSEGVHMEVAGPIRRPEPSRHRRRFRGNLRVLSGIYTQESLFTLILRPVVALSLPAVLWASLDNAVTIGMVILISTNFSSAFGNTYGFQPWQSGLTYISSIVGSLVAVLFGGTITDSVADKLTTINGGIRTPEMRLPTMIVPLVSGPLGCMLYGMGIFKSLHWICPVIGIGLGIAHPIYLLLFYFRSPS